MNRSQKRILRIVIITVLVLGAGIFALIGMNIKPADDYGDKLSGAIAEAEGAISSTALGQNDMNAPEVKKLISTLGEAKAVAEKKGASSNEKKTAYNNLTSAIDGFNDYTVNAGLTANRKDQTPVGQSAAAVQSSSAAPRESAAPQASSEAVQPSQQAQGSSAAQPASSEAAQPQQLSAQEQSPDHPGNNSENPANNSGGNNSNSGGSNGNSGGSGNKDSDKHTCSIYIQCNNLVGFKDLDESKKKYVPSDGVILKKTTVSFKEGDSVYNVLEKICSSKNIHLASKYTPAYDSYYIQGINHLFEFDGGPMSGWIYKVNGVAPNYGCSQYTVKDGDEIIWGYTCTGENDV